MAAADTFCSPTVVVPRAGLLCVFCLDLLKTLVFTSHIQHWLGTTEASLVSHSQHLKQHAPHATSQQSNWASLFTIMAALFMIIAFLFTMMA